MKFNLNNFEESFTESKLKAGLALLKSGLIEQNLLEKYFRIEHKKYFFIVNYSQKGNFVNLNCNCNVNKCIHIISILFFFNKTKLNIEIKPKLKVTSRQTKISKNKTTIIDILQNKDKDYLINLISDFAEKDEKIFTKLIATIGTASQFRNDELIFFKISHLLTTVSTENNNDVNFENLSQSIFQLQTHFYSDSKIEFTIHSILNVFKYYLKNNASTFWLKDFIDFYGNNLFQQVSYKQIEKTKLPFGLIIKQYFKINKNETQKLLPQYIIKLLWAINSYEIVEILNTTENVFININKNSNSENSNIDLIKFIQKSKKIKNNYRTIDVNTNSIVSCIALFEFDVVLAEKLLLQILNANPNLIFNNYQYSDYIFASLNQNKLDKTLTTFITQKFITTCSFENKYLVKFKELNKPNLSKEVLSIFNYWYLKVKGNQITELFNFVLYFNQHLLCVKLINSHKISFNLINQFLNATKHIYFEELMSPYITSINMRLNEINTIRSQEIIFNEIYKTLNFQSHTVKLNFFGKLYKSRILTKYFHKLIEKEITDLSH